MRTIHRFLQELSNRCAGITLIDRLLLRSVSTTPATTNDNKTGKSSECTLVSLNNHFKCTDGVWNCLQKKSTILYNGYRHRRCEYDLGSKNGVELFLNLSSTNSRSHLKECSCNLDVLAGLAGNAAVTTTTSSINQETQSEDNLIAQSIIGRSALKDKGVLGLAHLFSLITHTTENCFHNDK